MKLTDIETLPIEDDMSDRQQRIRKEAPRLIASIINDTRALSSVGSIEDMRSEHIKPLGGGVDAATYLVNLPDKQRIIKIGSEGINAEVEAIQAWQNRGARVPKIIHSGVVPTAKNANPPLRYLVQEALVDRDGRIVETAANYLIREPGKSRRIGQELGVQLNIMHSCVAERSFGEFQDSEGSASLYKSWNGYIVDATAGQLEYLEKLGIEKSKLGEVIKRLKDHKFIKRGRYLHGDFSIRNVAIKQYDPLKISVFDPNTLVGDPSWDISFLANNYEFEKKRLTFNEDHRDLYVQYQQLWIGFKKGYERTIDEFSLLSARLVQAVYQAQYKQTTGNKLDFRARKEVIADIIEAMIR